MCIFWEECLAVTVSESSFAHLDYFPSQYMVSFQYFVKVLQDKFWVLER